MNVTSVNLKNPFFAVTVVVPVNVGVYDPLAELPVINKVAVEVLSDPTTCPNLSTSAT